VLARELAAGDRVGAPIEIESGDCLALTAIASDGLQDLDLELRSTDGEIVGSDRGPGALSRLRLCSASDRSLRLELVALGGSGAVRVRLHRLPAARLPRQLREGPLPLREAAVSCARQGLEPLADRPTLEELDEGEWSATLRLAGGRCYAIVVVRGSEAIEQLELTDRDERLVGWWRGPGTPATLSRCPAEEERYRLRVLAAGTTARPPEVFVFGADAAGGGPLLEGLEER
jgi:hypothetical protein